MDQKLDPQIQTALTLAHHDYARNLNLYAAFKLGDQEIAEDLVQATFMKTWNYLVGGGKIDLMKAFLYHVLNDLIIDEYRKNKPTSLDLLIGKGFEPTTSIIAPFSILDGKAIILLIQQLPEPYSKIMRMKYVQDLSLKEISLITGQTKNAVAVQIHRGIKKLKALQGEAGAMEG